jgi:hypothetical protein
MKPGKEEKWVEGYEGYVILLFITGSSLAYEEVVIKSHLSERPKNCTDSTNLPPPQWIKTAKE